jgi:hypothetical protein
LHHRWPCGKTGGLEAKFFLFSWRVPVDSKLKNKCYR